MVVIKLTHIEHIPKYCDDCIYYGCKPHPYKGWTDSCELCTQCLDDDQDDGWIYDGNERPKNCPLIEVDEPQEERIIAIEDIESENNENDKMNKENSNLTIPKALSGACFHGEIWLKCPHCGSGNQMMGRQALYKEDGYLIYKCDECGKLFKDR